MVIMMMMMMMVDVVVMLMNKVEVRLANKDGSQNQ